MNKFKVLGVALMLSIIVLVGGSYFLGMTSIQYMSSGYSEFLHSLGLLCVTLFGSLAALNLDQQYE